MKSLRLAIGADHRGYTLKEFLKKKLTTIDGKTIEWIDVGTNSEQRTDYPIYAERVAKAILSGTCMRGVLVCGSGAGVTVAANRFKKIYAGVAWTPEMATLIHEHDNINVLVISSDYVSQRMAKKMIIAWFNAKFLGGRYQLRIDMVDAL